jgi:hypothetical protein
MNSLDTAYSSTTCGLLQSNSDATHGNNTLDKFLTSRTDLFAYCITACIIIIIYYVNHAQGTKASNEYSVNCTAELLSK